MTEKELSKKTVRTMRGYLFRWLTPKNQEQVTRMLRFYNDAQQVNMMDALLRFLMFGEKKRFIREVERWHFKIIVSKIEEDFVTPSPHSLTVRMLERYGMLEPMDF